MLRIIQIITLLQGLFLLVVFLSNRKKYRKPPFWLLIGSIISILLYILGDDENRFLSKNIDLFYFDASLFITFLFLFIKYFVSGKNIFNLRHLLFFLPNIAYFVIEIIENQSKGQIPIAIEIMEVFTELVFLLYLILSVWLLYRFAEQKWMLYFVVPLVIITSLSILDEAFEIVGITENNYLTDPSLNTYLLVLVAFLFYFISLKLVMAPSEIMHLSETKKYKSSGLNEKLIKSYIEKIIDFMEREKGYMDGNLSLTLMAQKLDIPKQYISEILNVHLSTNFQDFLNSYRVDAFIEKLNNPKFSNLTLVAIASEVGFGSKSNFYTAFKKFKGLTPSEYKKTISSQ